MSDSIVIGGSLAQKPHQAGHTWVFLQYLLGFKKLGWDVLFIDALEPSMCVDAAGRPAPFEESANLSYHLDVMGRFGLEDDFCLIYDRGNRYVGRDRQSVLDQTRSSAFLLNVMGFIRDEEILEAAQRRVFLDIDPGYGQMWQDLGLAYLLTDHDDYLTIAENIGREDCPIPTCDIDWHTCRQPVVLDEWPFQESPPRNSFTSIGSWRGQYEPIEYGGKTYGLRVHEFRKFLELPQRTGQEFEMALEIDSSDAADSGRLKENAWRLVDPRRLAADPRVYRDFIQRSKAEFMVARNMYVEAACGWFSDRSTCYLASGRPVLAQDTGIRDLYPTGLGLLAFSDMGEAVDGVEAISSDYARHSRAAREIAEAYFDSEKVLTAVLDKLGASTRVESRVV